MYTGLQQNCTNFHLMIKVFRDTEAELKGPKKNYGGLRGESRKKGVRRHQDDVKVSRLLLAHPFRSLSHSVKFYKAGGH